MYATPCCPRVCLHIVLELVLCIQARLISDARTCVQACVTHLCAQLTPVVNADTQLSDYRLALLLQMHPCVEWSFDRWQASFVIADASKCVQLHVAHACSYTWSQCWCRVVRLFLFLMRPRVCKHKEMPTDTSSTSKCKQMQVNASNYEQMEADVSKCNQMQINTSKREQIQPNLSAFIWLIHSLDIDYL